MIFRLNLDPNAEESVVATVRQRSALTDRIESLVRQHSGADRLTVYAEDEMRLLTFDRIECIFASEGRVCAVDVQGRQYRLKQRLYELEALLPEYFIRINKSALANERRIERFAASFSGAVDAVFKCGYREYVSRRCFAAIKRRYEK